MTEKLLQPMMEEIDLFGEEEHDRHNPTHSKNKGHFCLDFDDLWICEDCEEFSHCYCFERREEE